MGDYTIKNLRDDVDDSAPQFGLAPDLEARFARDPLDCEKLGLSYQRLAPNTRGAFGHRHNEQEEVYVVVDGGGRIKLEDEIRDLRQWDAVRVAPSVTRAFEAGEDGLTLIAFGAPKTAGQDAELIQGWWSD